MTDLTTPEVISDDALDTAAGGAGGANPMDLKRGIDTAAALGTGRRAFEPIRILKRVS